MKKSFLAFALALICISCADAQQPSLTVKLSDVTGDTMVVAVINKEMRDYDARDKVVRTEGEFTYNFKGDKARLAILTVKTAQGPKRLQAFLVPGEQGTVTGTADSCQWSGSKFYTDLETVKDPMAFIKANPSNNVSAALLLMMEDPEPGMQLLSQEVKKGVFSDICDATEVSIQKEKARKEAAKFVADGLEAPDFTLNDINGKPLSLKSLRGKYVVLDFWGSWCIWCIRGIPEMKKTYEKYKGKLEILGVDCNDTPEKWKAAVEKHQIPWKHVYNPKDSKLTSTYAIQGYPTKVIIDPKGKIVKTVIGEDPEFYTFLDELMK